MPARRFRPVRQAARTPGDARYADIESQLTTLGQARDHVAADMRNLPEDAEFHGGHVDHPPRALAVIAESRALIAAAQHIH